MSAIPVTIMLCWMPLVMESSCAATARIIPPGHHVVGEGAVLVFPLVLYLLPLASTFLVE